MITFDPPYLYMRFSLEEMEKYGQCPAKTRLKRIENKAIENRNKKTLTSPDVVNADDFTYEPFAQERGEDGDSGGLLLATHKKNISQKYIIKHAYCDCAAHEFIYNKMARAMGLKMPDVKLFRLSDPLDDTLFKTEYVVGIQYLNIIDENPSPDIAGKAKNADDYFKFYTLQLLFADHDAMQTVLADDGYIYRIDCTDGFGINGSSIISAGVNSIDHLDNFKGFRNYPKFNPGSFSRLWDIPEMDFKLRNYIEIFGENKYDAIMEPLFTAQKVYKPYIDEFLDTLCYFYPEVIGCYYSGLLVEMKKTMKRYTNFLTKYK